MLGNLRQFVAHAGQTKSTFQILGGIAFVAGVGFVQPQPAQAQAVEAALAEARARVACGAGTPVSAVYLPSGAIQVTCRQNLPEQTATTEAARQAAPQPQSTPPNALAGTGLATAPVVATVMAAVVLSIVVGDGGSTTTTAVDAPIEPQ